MALNLGHWAAAAIAVAKFFATAQNLAPRAAKLPLLKRYKDLDYAGAFLQGLKGLPNDCVDHASAYG